MGFIILLFFIFIFFVLSIVFGSMSLLIVHSLPLLSLVAIFLYATTQKKVSRLEKKIDDLQRNAPSESTKEDASVSGAGSSSSQQAAACSKSIATKSDCYENGYDETNAAEAESDTSNYNSINNSEPVVSDSDSTFSPDNNHNHNHNNNGNHNNNENISSLQTPGSQTPGFLSKLYDFFTTGNVVAKVGVVVLFFGFAFLLKYAAEHSHFPIKLRMIVAAITAFVFIAAGWRMRHKENKYGLILQGCGFGLLYIITFISFYKYHLLSAGEAEMISVALSVAAMSISCLLDSKSMAVLSQFAAFSTPFLCFSDNIFSTLSNFEISYSLFMYYSILNIGVAYVAFRKSWRMLNVIGMLSTFLVLIFCCAFGNVTYPTHPEFILMQSFLVVTMLIYTTINIVFYCNDSSERNIDNTLTFGVPLLAALVEYVMTSNHVYFKELTSILFSVYYLFAYFIVSWLSRKLNKDNLKLLFEPYICFFSVFLLFFVYYKASNITALSFLFRHVYVSVLFSVLGLIKMAYGLRHDMRKLQLVAAVTLMSTLYYNMTFQLSLISSGPYPVLVLSKWGHLPCLISTLIVVAAAAVCAVSNKSGFVVREVLSKFLFVVSFIILIYLSLIVTSHTLLFIGVACLGFYFLGSKIKWTFMQNIGMAYLPLLALNYIQPVLHSAIFSGFYYFTAPSLINIIVQFVLLAMFDKKGSLKGLSVFYHVCSYVLLVFALLHYTPLLFNNYLHWSSHSAHLMSYLYALLLSALFARYIVKVNVSPFKYHIELYQKQLCAFTVAALSFAVALANNNIINIPLYDGEVYIPLLNSLDIILLVATIFVYSWLRENLTWLSSVFEYSSNLIYILFGAWIVNWVSVMTLRAVHYWTGVPYVAHDLYMSTLAQASLTIVWSVMVFVALFLAQSKKIRQLWWAGMVLLAMIVVKLFTIDLHGLGSIYRIVAFVAVGFILISAGYFSPAAPEVKKELSAE